MPMNLSQCTPASTSQQGADNTARRIEKFLAGVKAVRMQMRAANVSMCAQTVPVRNLNRVQRASDERHTDHYDPLRKECQYADNAAFGVRRGWEC